MSAHQAPSGENLENNTSRRGSGVAGGGGGPHDPVMENRVTALEVGFQEMRGDIRRLELSVARIEAAVGNLATMVGNLAATMGGLPTKSDIAVLAERIAAQGDRLTKVEIAIDETIKIALRRMIGPWQLPGVLVTCVALIGLLLAAFNWVDHQPWYPH